MTEAKTSTPLMRYPAEAVEMLKNDDPDTRVTLHFVRGLVKSGVLKSINVGHGKMINYYDLLEFLTNPAQMTQPNRYGQIRPVQE